MEPLDASDELVVQVLVSGQQQHPPASAGASGEHPFPYADGVVPCLVVGADLARFAFAAAEVIVDFGPVAQVEVITA